MARAGRHHLTRSRRSPGGRALAGVAVLLCLLAAGAAIAAGLRLTGGGDGGAGGTPMAAERIDPQTSGLAIRRVPDGSQGPLAAAQESLVAAVISDLDDFWATTVPAVAGQDFTPLRGGVTAVDSAAPTGSTACVSRPDRIGGNAYYCPDDDGIVYDSSALVPVLLYRYGAPGLVGAFAHEFGHAVQARIGPTPEERNARPARYPSLLIEAQGDCDAGAFLRWVVAGKARHIHLDAGAMLATAGPLLDFADPVTVPTTDSAAHGLSLDRLTSLLLGYRQGAAACHAMTLDSLHPTLGAIRLPPGGAAALVTPRYAGTPAVLAAAGRSIAAFTGSPVTATAAPADLASAAPYGQFAEATALALTVGRQSYGSAAGAACFAGAWAASVFGDAPPGSLGSWPGDADEGLDLVRTRAGASFADAAGYADGFHQGVTACR
jgi:predicted metalloprotease